MRTATERSRLFYCDYISSGDGEAKSHSVVDAPWGSQMSLGEISLRVLKSVPSLDALPDATLKIAAKRALRLFVSLNSGDWPRRWTTITATVRVKLVKK